MSDQGPEPGNTPTPSDETAGSSDSAEDVYGGADGYERGRLPTPGQGRDVPPPVAIGYDE